MDEELAAPWWRTPLKIAASVFGLLALAALLMTLIVLTARIFEMLSEPAPARPIYIEPPPVERNARTYVPTPDDPQWPDSPARRQPARIGAANATGARVAATPSGPSVPTGLSVEAYREAVAAGKKLYIPNPQGLCELSGAQSANALDECFAARVAR
ncbi:MAG: hypothetical protein ACK4Q4_07080 [Rhodocyclaceae bacterium]